MQVEVVRSTLAGQPCAKVAVDLDVPPGGAQTVVLPDDLANPGTPAAELLVAGSGPGRALWFFISDVEVAYAPAAFDASVQPVADGYRVVITAATLLRDLALFPDRLDPTAEVDEALLTLLPGEAVTLHVRTAAPVDTDQLVRHPVLRCVNDLVAR